MWIVASGVFLGIAKTIPYSLLLNNYFVVILIVIIKEKLIFLFKIGIN